MSDMSSGCYVIDSEFNIVNMNETASTIYPGLKVGEKCYKCLMGLDEPCGPCPVVNSKKGPKTYEDPIRGISEVVDAVDMPVEGHGLCHALIFSTVGIREELAAKLPVSSGELSDMALVRVLNEIEFDTLTGLYSREAFILRSEKLLKEHPDMEYDFCISRVSNLHTINHQYGSAMGDKTLALIGRLLSMHGTDYNCIGYIGDGTFASFTPNDPDDVRKRAVMNFRDDVLKHSDIREISLKWSIYTRIDRDMPIEDIIDRTRYALSMIRMDDNRDYIEFDQTVIERMERELEIESAFERSIARGEFVPYFQPKVDLKTGEIVGAEALVRWVRADGSLLPPGEFIPVFEKNGQINRLDEYIFRRVCATKAQMLAAGLPDLPVSVNLSRASLFTKDIAETYSMVADEYRLDKSKLPIEITESAAIRAKSITEFARELTDKGFPIHMDDFGIGYSSLVSLLHLPFECIKLDKSLIDTIGSESSNKLLKHTIAFARECGKQVVAEGVEREDQIEFLRSIGCDMGQGFYYSKPVDKETFFKMF